MSVETVICFPLLLWGFAATFLFWDVFYAQSANMRAANTIADALSRETGYVNAAYLDGLEDTLVFLIKNQHASRLRVTTLKWDAINARFDVIWSHSVDPQWPAQTTASLATYSNQIPPLAPGDIAIVVETQLDYIPFFDVGIDPTTMNEFIVTRPRFGPQLVWQNPDGTLVGFAT